MTKQWKSFKNILLKCSQRHTGSEHEDCNESYKKCQETWSRSTQYVMILKESFSTGANS